MKAFVEILSGIVRAGPKAAAYGDPYEFAAAFSVDGDTATIKGLVRGEDALTTAHYRAAKRALAALGLKMKWERK